MRSVSLVRRQLGVCMAAIHAVRFPAPLQGTVGSTRVVLEHRDPVDSLQHELEQSRSWIATHRPSDVVSAEHVGRLIDAYASDIRAERPCLLHGDTTFDNFVVTPEGTLRPIDWDLPAVGYPLAELGNLDHQAYLYGIADGLPPEFWAGYGRTYPADLLLIHRAVRCLSLIASSRWAEWAADSEVSDATKAELPRRHNLHEKWVVATLPRRLRHA